jgi:hypothetical protein
MVAKRSSFVIPVERFLPVLIAEEAARGTRAPVMAAGSSSPSLGIAELARLRDLGAAPPRIEGVMGPFNRRVLAQGSLAPCALAANREACNLFTIQPRGAPRLSLFRENTPRRYTL